MKILDLVELTVDSFTDNLCQECDLFQSHAGFEPLLCHLLSVILGTPLWLSFPHSLIYSRG